MLNRKLLEVIKLLKDPERNQLRLFLQSPYFNNKGNAADLLRLFDCVLAHNAEETHPELSKANVSNIFYPNKPFIEGQKGPIDALSSDLFHLIKRFMAQVRFEQHDLEFETGHVMAKFYRVYGMEERFWQTIQSLRKVQEAQPYRDAGFFQKQFLLEDEAGSLETLNNRFEDDANVVTAIKNLDTAYAINRLELLCVFSYQQKLSQIVSYELNTPLTEAVLNFQSGSTFIAQFEIYKLVYQLIQSPENDDAFLTLGKLLVQHKTEIPFEKLRNLKAYFRFFWHRRYLKAGGAQVREQMFEVYKEHYEQGYFYEGDAIMINSLKVLVLFGLRLKQFDWVKAVLDIHPPERICGTKHPVEAHSLCLAEYYFYQKAYNRALETLIYKHFENPNYSLWAEMLLIKVYYETSDELLEYRIKALEQKVRRTNLSVESKSRYYQFVQKLSRIIKYGSQKASTKRAKLIEEVKTTPGINEREWLLEKLGEGT